MPMRSRFYSDYKRQIDNEDLSTVGQAFLRRTQFTYCEGALSFHGGWFSKAW
jgi:hypothetical protein